MKVSRGMGMWAVLTTGSSCFKDFPGVLSLVVLRDAVLMEIEGCLEEVPVLDRIPGCGGIKVSSFPLTGFGLCHTKRTNLVILTSFFRFASLSFPSLPSVSWSCRFKVYGPKGPGPILAPNPTIPPAWLNLPVGLFFPTPLIADRALRKPYHQMNVFWKHLLR